MASITRETWHVALDALRANKVKAALTMLGVIIGSACIVLVVTIALIGKTYVMAQIEGVGSNIVYATYNGGGGGVRSQTDELNLSDMEAIGHMAHVHDVAGTHDMGTSVIINGQVKPVALVGVTEGFQRIRNLLILEGRFFDDMDQAEGSKACLITQELARLLGPGPKVGRQLRVGEQTFTIIGVFRERVATFGQSEIAAQTVIIPFRLIKYYSGSDSVRTMYAQADTADSVPQVTANMQSTLRERHSNSASYQVQNLASILDAARKISFALTAVLMLVGMVALVISGVGIMNIMLVTVRERTKEIGLRKAVGARREEILYQFLIEAFIMSGVGALIGIAIACSVKIVVDPLIPAEIGLKIPISIYSVLLSFTVSCATGVLFGYLPARNASKLQPTESLRYE
ncbi:MAG: ABC transporter permease [Acidobacteriota bacterium]|nr:ABC transporter permease [Acidobacteriota bacterium]